MQRPSTLAIRNLADLTKKGERMSSLTSHRGRLPAILIVALVWGGTFALAQAASADAAAFPSDPPTIHASPISGPVVLDGKFSEEAWKNCVEVSDFATTAGGLPANAVSMRVGYTPETLYLAIECSGRTAKPLASLREHDANLCAEDSIELYLAPTFGKTDYFLFMANAIGTRFESHGMDASWNGPWQVAASSAGGNWRLEIAIPFSSLGIKPTAGMTLGLNLCRNDPSNGQTTTWCGRQHDPASWGRLVLGQRAFGVSEIALKQTAKKEVAATATFHNPGPLPAKATLIAVMQTPMGALLPHVQQEVGAGANIPLMALAPEWHRGVGRTDGLAGRCGRRTVALCLSTAKISGNVSAADAKRRQRHRLGERRRSHDV